MPPGGGEDGAPACGRLPSVSAPPRRQSGRRRRRPAECRCIGTYRVQAPPPRRHCALAPSALLPTRGSTRRLRRRTPSPAQDRHHHPGIHPLRQSTVAFDRHSGVIAAGTMMDGWMDRQTALGWCHATRQLCWNYKTLSFKNDGQQRQLKTDGYLDGEAVIGQASSDGHLRRGTTLRWRTSRGTG